MNAQAPIVIIGCGRSGSTLMDRVLNAHPAIHMIGETKFLTARLWRTLGECADGSMWNAGARLAYRYRASATADAVRPGDDEWAEMEKRRLGTIVNRAVAELFELPQLEKPRWGMKEIWNGGADNVGWDIYDLVYPDAVWVHVVRSPLGYVRSAFGWKGRTPTLEELRHQLQTWLHIVRKSRERRDTGRYVEIRYEDLVESPEDALAALFALLGLCWNDDCLFPLRQNWVATRHLPLIDPEWFKNCVEDLGMAPMLDELGYSVTVPDELEPVSYATAVLRDANGNLVIDRHIERGIGPYWLFVLPTAPAIRDALEAGGARSSSLVNFAIVEDGRPLERIDSRVELYKGALGCFFANEVAIMFTTSDNSDPRTNGRQYGICPS